MKTSLQDNPTISTNRGIIIYIFKLNILSYLLNKNNKSGEYMDNNIK